MFTIDLQSRNPVSQQIFDNLRDQIISGIIPTDAKLPSVRELSERLAVSPNTCMKSFKRLEERGYVYTSAGLGTYAAPKERWQDAKHLHAYATELLRRTITEFLHCGTNRETVVKLTIELYDELAANHLSTERGTST
ncbi:MAG: GntR family transcriptional regulator [Oscillospiraceae bacterium]|nr:GntR family transcriptional regulator [Oscillospiraceae bacterium]